MEETKGNRVDRESLNQLKTNRCTGYNVKPKQNPGGASMYFLSGEGKVDT